MLTVIATAALAAIAGPPSQGRSDKYVAGAADIEAASRACGIGITRLNAKTFSLDGLVVAGSTNDEPERRVDCVRRRLRKTTISAFLLD